MRITPLAVALLALLALAAGSASAASAHEWQRNHGKGSITKPRGISSMGHLVIFTESEEYAEEETCSFNEKGTVGPGAAGTITSLTSTSGSKVIECIRNEGAICREGKHAPRIEAAHLPWDTELTTVEGKLRDEIKSGGSGTPELKMECEGYYNIKDKCPFASGVGVENMSNGDVEGIYTRKESNPLYGYDCGGLSGNHAVYYEGVSEEIWVTAEPTVVLDAI